MEQILQMGKYLDPKSDVVFKKIFGQHPHLLKSFLNAVLPLPEDSQIIKSLALIFVELPKFKASSSEAKKLKVLWLRFMKEITDQTREVDPALLAVPEIKEALSLAEEAAYSPAELEFYESYWKSVSSEKTMRDESLLKGIAKGKAEGKAETKQEIAKELKRKGVPLMVIAECTGLSVAEIEKY